MAVIPIENLKELFETWDRPTQEHFENLIDTLAAMPWDYVKHFWYDPFQSVYVYLWFKQIDSEKWRIRRFERATGIYTYAKWDIDWQIAWDDKENLTYSTEI